MPIHSSLRFLLALAPLLGFVLPDPAAAQGTSVPRTCGKAAVLNSAAATTVQVIPPTSGPGSLFVGTIYVCGYTIVAAAADNVSLVYGTGTNCGTGQQPLTATYDLAANAILVDGSAFFRGLDVPSGNNLCVTTSSAGPAGITIYYDNNPL